MANPENQSQIPVGKTRRRHQKSRNGCSECKRRRVKCDEMKPACMRCVLLLDKCVYPAARKSAEKDQKDELSLPGSSPSILSLSPGTLSYLERSSSSASSSKKSSTRSTPEFVAENRLANATESSDGLSDTDLYHHYLQHTSRTLTHSQKDTSALQIGMPTLALKSKTVFHSVLAVSAACLACDMISKESPPDINKVNNVLMTGYRHYNLASERMRESISQPDALKLETLLASALILVPFATASQQINHWISARNQTQESLHKPLSTTPRDVIVIMRGIRTTLQTLDCGNRLSRLNLEPSIEKEFAIDSSSELLEANTRTPPPHVMVPILATTSQGAFSKLQKRLDSVFLYPNHSNCNSHSLSACSAAFELLKDIRSKVFSASGLSSSSSSFDDVVEDDIFEHESASSLPQVAPWLRSFTNRSVNPSPTDSLTRFLLTFYIQAPQAYLDLVLPLLDQRLQSPIGGATSDNILTKEQALALDIYAHWSVLMFLVEEESWWIGNLPVVTLAGTVNKYGDKFVTRLWPENGPGQDQPWWPGSMLKILQEVKRYR